MAVAFVCLAVLVGAARAEALPSVTYKCTPAPQDCTGWYTSDVSLTWTVLPSDATKTGCQDQTFTSDTTGTSVFCKAEDDSGAVTVELRIKVDQTPPTVVGGQPARGADVDGWYNHAVGVRFSGNDPTSGVAACTDTTYGGPDSGSASVAGTCTDNAGNVSSPFPYGLKYDETAPVLTGASPDHAANAAGWFNSPVRFTIEADDATSGIADCPDVSYSTPDSAAASITGDCHDHAGNAASRAFALKYDATAPVASGAAAARGPDVNGWYNQDVRIDFAGTDRTSGVAACTVATYSGPDSANAAQPGTCSDNAGNVSPAVRFPLKFDKTKPVVDGGAPARAANANGWYKDPVLISFSGTDATSGLGPAACTAATYAGPDSGAAAVAGTCTDNAGNVSTPFPYGLRYDATSPTVLGATPGRAPNANGWYKDPVSVTFNGDDRTSGVATCTAGDYSGPDSAAAAVPGSCTDNAGNVSSALAFPLKYDETSPSAATAIPARAPNAAGWYKDPVSVTFGGTDQTSGIANCTAAEYSGPDSATASQPGTCTDKAGNVSAALAFALKYDGTAPSVATATPARQPNANGWYKEPVKITFAGSDQTSGVADCTNTDYAGPDGGALSVPGTCSDKAGNVSAPLGFAIKYDETSPGVSGATAARVPDLNGWYNHGVEITFRGTDQTSGVDTCTKETYSGPDGLNASQPGTCTDKAGNTSGELGFRLNYDDTAPVVDGANAVPSANANGWFNSPVSLVFAGHDATSGLGAGACTTASYAGPDSATASVDGSCTDRAGNSSGTVPFRVKYDQTPPTVNGATPDRRPNANGWFNRAVRFTVDGADDTSGIAECPAVTYGGPDTAAPSFVGACRDQAGNSAGRTFSDFKYDETGPQVTGATAARPPDHAGWYVDPVRFDVTGTDATSGLDVCPPVTYSGPDAASGAVSAQCRDKAGNTTSRAFPLKFDGTAPPIAQLNAIPGNGLVVLAWRTTTDAKSVELIRSPGASGAAASLVFRGPGTSFVDRGVVNGVRYAYQLRLGDAAGNASSRTVFGIPTAPVVPPAVPPPAPPPPVVTGPHLIAPQTGATVAAGRALRFKWTRVPRARYYNVQLFRSGRKILSAWPSGTRYRLAPQWRFKDKRRKLTPGVYRWMVWPGFGPRSRNNYGKRIGAGRFRVVARSDL